MRILLFLFFLFLHLLCAAQLPFSVIERTDLLNKYVLGSNFGAVDGKVKPVTVGALGVELGLARPSGEVVYGTGTGVTSVDLLKWNTNRLSLKSPTVMGNSYVDFSDDSGLIGYFGAGSTINRDMYLTNYNNNNINFSTSSAIRAVLNGAGFLKLNNYITPISVPITPVGSLLFAANGDIGTSTLPLRRNAANTFWDAEGFSIQNKNKIIGFGCSGTGYIYIGEFGGNIHGGTCLLKVVGGRGYNSSINEHTQANIFLRNGNGNTSDGTKNLSILVNRFGAVSNFTDVKAIPKTNLTGAATNWDIYLQVFDCLGSTEMIVEPSANTSFIVAPNLNIISVVPSHVDMVTSVDIFTINSPLNLRTVNQDNAATKLAALSANNTVVYRNTSDFLSSSTIIPKATEALNAITRTTGTKDTFLLGGTLDRNTEINTGGKEFFINSYGGGGVHQNTRHFGSTGTKIFHESNIGSSVGDSSWLSMDWIGWNLDFGNVQNIGGSRTQSNFKIDGLLKQEVVQKYTNGTENIEGGMYNDLKNGNNNAFYIKNNATNSIAYLQNYIESGTGYISTTLGLNTTQIQLQEDYNFFQGIVTRTIINGLPTAFDNNMAITQGLVLNQIYQTPTGELRIRY